MPVNRLMKFVELCKACGVTISPSESVAFTDDFANVALANKVLLEEATVACLAKDSESEAIARKLFHFFFTGRPKEEQKKESDDDHVESQLAHALQQALESGDLPFDNLERNENPAFEQSGGMKMSPETSGDFEPTPSAEAKIPTEQFQSHPNIQAVPTHHPQIQDQEEIERELAQFMHDNLSARDLEQIIELLEKLDKIQDAVRLAGSERLESPWRWQPGQATPDDEQAGNEDIKDGENVDKQELPTDADEMSEQQNDQGTSDEEQKGNGRSDDGEAVDSDEIGTSLDMDAGLGESALEQGDEGEIGLMGRGIHEGAGLGNLNLRQDLEGEMGFMGRGNHGAAGSNQNFRDNSMQQNNDAIAPQNTTNQNISRFNVPLSLEAAQILSAAFVQELVMFNVPPSLGGRLARLMNPEQGQNLAQQHQMALELWMLTDQERERLLQSLEHVVGRLLLQDAITPEEFAEYSALFDEYLKAQITIAGAGAETHLKNIAMMATLLTEYKSESRLLRVIVSRLSTAMHRLLTRRMPIYTKSAGGKLDVRKTIRQSLQYGGVPMEFIYREKVLWEDIVLALDTSGSQVWWAVSAMLFACAFEKTARRLRVYSFTSDIEDVTKYVPHPEKFVEHLDDFAGYSNYETSFQKLLSKAPISPRTTLIIVGDCRDFQGSWHHKSPDKYGQRIGPKSAKLVSKMVTRSSKVIVLNPEEKLKWGVGDSAVLDYENAGAIVKYVASPIDLAEQLMSV